VAELALSNTCRLNFTPRSRVRRVFDEIFASVCATAALSVMAAAGCSGDVYEGMPTTLVIDAPELPGSLERLTIVVSEAELLPCQSAQTSWLPPLISVASAHTDSTPVKLGTPAILSFGDAPLTLGTLRLPPNCYEGVRVFLSAADEDAIGLDVFPALLGLSVLLESRQGTPPSGSSAAAELTLRWPTPVSVVAVAGRREELRITLALAPDWLDAVPDDSGSAALVGLRISSAEWTRARRP
jgi:hypothetical protein